LPAVSVVVPLRDEAASLPELISALEGLAAKVQGGFEVIAVDDGSIDGSFGQLAHLRRDRPWLRAVELARSFGKSAALAAGFERARGDVILTCDADLQDDLSSAPALIAEVREGRADVAVGRRTVRRDPLSKRAPSAVFNWLVRRAGGVGFQDVNSGLKALRREVALECDLYGERHRLVPLIAALDGRRVIEMPVGHAARKHGRSKYGGGRFLRGLLDLMTVVFLASYGLRPGHFFGGVGIATGAAGALICFYLAYLRLATGSIQFRYPLLALGVLLIVVGFQLVTTGFLAELIVQRSRRDRPRYAVRRTLE
jgi:glycosyltransferase involved in cell wall biosynthesis